MPPSCKRPDARRHGSSPRAVAKCNNGGLPGPHGVPSARLTLRRAEYAVRYFTVPRLDWQALQRRHQELLEHAGWQQVFERRGVRAALVQLPDESVPVVRCDTAIATTPTVLAEFLVQDILETLPHWNPVFGGGEVLEVIDDGERVLRLVNRLPWPLRKREDVFYNACKRLADGTIVELSKQVEHPAAPPRSDMIRSGLHLATKRMVPRSDGGCDYTAMWHYDLGGALGRWMPRRMLARTVVADLARECDRLRARYGIPAAGSG